MPALTAVRASRHGRVELEVDGARWRVVPVDVAFRLGLAAGVELDRPLLRELARELRRAGALQTATRALAARDLSAAGVARVLASRGTPPRTRAETVAALERAGIVDDERFAGARAARLAARDFGDEAIIADLIGRGIDEGAARRAVAELPPEEERACRVAAARGAKVVTARYLARRGFGSDAVERAVASAGWEE